MTMKKNEKSRDGIHQRGQELGASHRSHVTEQEFPAPSIPEQEKRGHGSDANLSRQVRIFLDVDDVNLDVSHPFKNGFQFLNQWSHLLARLAPRSLEVVEFIGRHG